MLAPRHWLRGAQGRRPRARSDLSRQARMMVSATRSSAAVTAAARARHRSVPTHVPTFAHPFLTRLGGDASTLVVRQHFDEAMRMMHKLQTYDPKMTTWVATADTSKQLSDAEAWEGWLSILSHASICLGTCGNHQDAFDGFDAVVQQSAHTELDAGDLATCHQLRLAAASRLGRFDQASISLHRAVKLRQVVGHKAYSSGGARIFAVVVDLDEELLAEHGALAFDAAAYHYAVTLGLPDPFRTAKSMLMDGLAADMGGIGEHDREELDKELYVRVWIEGAVESARCKYEAAVSQ